MSDAGAGNGQQPWSDKNLSNQALIDLLIPTTAAITKPKPGSRPPKFLSNMERRTPNGMINPAPRPVIRTEENDPTPPLSAVVDALNGRTAAAHNEGLRSSKKQKLGVEKAVNPLPKPAIAASSKRGPKIPETPTQAEKWDQMLWEKKLEGKGWMEIAEEWENLTGTKTETRDDGTDRETLRKRRQLIDKLAVRFVKLKESYAASGTMELPESVSETHPVDLKYRKISDRKKQDIGLFNIMEMTKIQMEADLWNAFCRNYQLEVGEEISVAEARGRYEALVNGVAKLKPTVTEEKDLLEIKKEIITDPVAIKNEDEE